MSFQEAKRKKRGGFTLVEILVAIVILAILFGMTITAIIFVS